MERNESDVQSLIDNIKSTMTRLHEEAVTLREKLTETETLLKKRTLRLKDCINELCCKGGDYQDEHLGACSGCRWKELKDEMREGK